MQSCPVAKNKPSGGYELLDSGGGRKLERFGRYVIARPCSQALWDASLPAAQWSRADASFDREDGNRWHGRANLPDEWTIETGGIKFRLGGTDFGHLGIFPEQRAQWSWLRRTCAAAKAAGRTASVLNLFAYSGGSTMACLLGGAEACHLDASKGMVDWARANAALNGLSGAKVRWITDDAHKFMKREVRRGRRYDAIILDPPTFGRGAGGEMYKIERDLHETLSLARQLLSDKPLFLLFSSHTPGVTCQAARNIIDGAFRPERIECGEMLLEGPRAAVPCPSGVFCRALWNEAVRSCLK